MSDDEEHEGGRQNAEEVAQQARERAMEDAERVKQRRSSDR